MESIQLSNIEMSFGDKELFKVQNLLAYPNDRIGIIGKNGQGKTTLLNIIAGKLNPNKGDVKIFEEFNYFEQILSLNEDDSYDSVDPKLLSSMRVPMNNLEHLSGGEQTKLELARIISNYKAGLILDEPTTHLDKKGIDLLLKELEFYYGTLIFVSHDRYFLNNLATKIWEVSSGTVREYQGNYDDYIRIKTEEELELENRKHNIDKEKDRLRQAVEIKKEKAKSITKVSEKNKNKHIQPNRLAASKQKDTAQKNMSKSVKSMEKRIEKLEDIHIEKRRDHISFPKIDSLSISNKFPVIGSNVTLIKGSNKLLSNVNFQFPLGQKIAIMGDNGCGKSTLLNYITKENEGITLSKKIKFSIYKQMDYKFTENEDKSILEYLSSLSEYPESFLRTILNKLGFNHNDIKKTLNVLSGGEATRLALATLFSEPSNVIILDEPTNFIDVHTVDALETFIRGYEGTIIFTSHDQYFINRVADQVWEIDNMNINLVRSNM